MYHLQRYAAAMAVLEPLYRNIEPIDEVCYSYIYASFFPSPLLPSFLLSKTIRVFPTWADYLQLL